MGYPRPCDRYFNERAHQGQGGHLPGGGPQGHPPSLAHQIFQQDRQQSGAGLRADPAGGHLPAAQPDGPVPVQKADGPDLLPQRDDLF